MAEHDAEHAQALADAMTQAPGRRRIDEATVAQQTRLEGGVDVVLDTRRVVGVERPFGEHRDIRYARSRTGWAARPRRSSVRSRAARETSSNALSVPGRRRSSVTSSSITRSRIVDGQPPRLGRTRQRHEIDDGTRDDTERATGADDELRRVDAPAVLAQRPPRTEQRRLVVGDDDLGGEHEAAHRAVAKNPAAAGVGGDHPTDHRVGAEVDGQLQSVFGGGRVELRQPASRRSPWPSRHRRRSTPSSAAVPSRAPRSADRRVARNSRRVRCWRPGAAAGCARPHTGRTTARTSSTVAGTTTMAARPRSPRAGSSKRATSSTPGTRVVVTPVETERRGRRDPPRGSSARLVAGESPSKSCGRNSSDVISQPTTRSCVTVGAHHLHVGSPNRTRRGGHCHDNR